MTDKPASPSIPPVAPVRPTVTTVHGQRLQDDYAWLKAENWHDVLRDPNRLPADIRAYLEDENAYSAGLIGRVSGLQSQLVAEMRGRIKEDDTSVPEKDGPFAYFVRHRTGGQHQLYCRSERAGGDPVVLLDGDALAAGKPFYHLGGRRHSDDHKLLAWSCDEAGSEFYAIRVRDMTSLDDLGDLITETTGHVVWDKQGRSFLYVAVDENHRPRQVKRHVVGTPMSADTLVYEEKVDGWFVNIDRSQSGDFAFIGISDHETSEAYVLPCDDYTIPPRLIAPRDTAVRYDIDHDRDRFVILTNADGAEDFKIVTAPVDAPGRENWRDLVPHHAGVMILSIMPFARHLVRLERENALPRIVIRSLADGSEHSIAFAEEAYSLRASAGLEFDTSTVRFTYSSMTTPNETYDYDMDRRERTLLKRQEVPSGHDSSAYVTKRLMATAPDGALVPVSILHRRDLRLDHSAPCLLYGYGAYGYAMPASFDTQALSMVDRGFVYAIAHIRGGTEKGWAWYTQGKREHKTNTFTDFIAAARLLAGTGYTAPGRIVAQGRSAGGMLMGAVANLAPDLFSAIIAEVPFVDVLNTMLDATLPLTPPEWPEWGNPIVSEADFRTIAAYSPYENVARRRMPAILAVGGLTDPRVTYWEPAKWVAQIRARMTEGGPVLLRIDMDSGHGGASGRFDRLKEVAQSYAFAIGITEGQLQG